ncbi:threonine/serine ThrE exporter family protein [Tundrisphaera sp. TA3]|uniref:threonine/serine ThrE exporter family protein n=1 Tax=Tundrisphaera sp. TA3 TaxID=3435775 RepID=UPI003EC02BFD
MAIADMVSEPGPPAPRNPEGIVPEREVLFTLAKTLHQAGVPSHRLEATLARVAERLGICVEAFALPTGLILSAGRGEGAAVRLFRLPPRPTDLERLRRLTSESEAIARGEVPPAQAVARLEAVLAATPPVPPHAAHAVGLLLSAAAFSVFFGGGPLELLVAAFIGGVVGLIAMAFGGRRGASRRYELVAAFAAGLVATLVDHHLSHFIHWIPIASGLIVLLPGLALVDSIEELANGHLASGGARMAGVGSAFLALIFGVILGVNVAELAGSAQPDRNSVSFPTWALLPALAVVALGSVFRFHARLRDWPLILLASAVALAGSRIGGRLGNPLLGPFVGGLALGLTANLYSRFFRPTPQLLLVPGLALLVPGSMGFRSLEALVEGDSIRGIEQGFTMFLMGMALVAGLLFGNAQVDRPDRRDKSARARIGA